MPAPLSVLICAAAYLDHADSSRGVGQGAQ